MNPRLQMRLLLSIVALLGSCCASLHAKAAFFSESQLAERAQAIAIIELAAPVEDATKGECWTYRQKATARVVQLLAGTLPKQFVLHGEESFICAQCKLAKGRYLAFLSRDGKLWTGTNWQLSLRPIRNGKVEWYSKVKPSSPWEMNFQDAQAVIKRILALRAEVAPKQAGGK